MGILLSTLGMVVAGFGMFVSCANPDLFPMMNHIGLFVVSFCAFVLSLSD